MVATKKEDEPGYLHGQRVDQVVVHVGEGDAVLGAHRGADDHLVDVVELVPVFVPAKQQDKRTHTIE